MLIILNWGGVKIYFSIRYVLFFFLGYFFERYLQKMVFSQVAFGLSMLLFSLNVWRFSYGSSPLYVQIALGILASIVILNISKVAELTDIKQTKFYGKLVLFGKSSLVIYLAHYPVVQILKAAPYLNTDTIQAVPLFIVTSIIAFGICMLCEKFGKLISKTNLLNLLLFGKSK